MTDSFRLTLAQLNATLGDIDGNLAKARAAWEAGRDAGAQMVLLPEMFVTGYQTQDLVVKPAFTRDVMEKVTAFAATITDGPMIALGSPWVEDGKLYNALSVIHEGRVIHRQFKHELPNGDVFDEVRYFARGPIKGPFDAGGIRIGTPICEDAWHVDVCETLAESGAELLLIANGSPYRRGKIDLRMNHMVARVTETGLPLVYLNMVGGQDDQVFDGGSFVLNPGGHLAALLPVFEEQIAHVDFNRTPEGWRAETTTRAVHAPAIEQDYQAMTLGLGDYLRKSGFSKVVLGLSGGIDSALVAAIAADAMGPEAVHCVMLPSEYTSAESLEDAAGVATRIGAKLDTVAISGPRAAVTEALAPLFAGLSPDLTEENIQSRIRGLLLMALSNKTGAMLLTTGNKSEMAVGYATIYGDMAGGYNPIKDLYKTRVFETCLWRNANHRPWMKGPAGEVMPPRVIYKPPSAELRPDQKDEDSLPPYPVLDAILEMLVEGDASVADCIAAGYDRATVKRIEHLLYISEWKRHQSAPGTRLTTRAFWLDRRYPIVNRWRDQTGG